MTFMDVRELAIDGARAVVSRSGYSGEDGYEISLDAADTDRIARALLADDSVEAIGLGARDSLRLEAGLCLYGNDIDQTTTPVEANLKWAIQKARRAGGEREGGFPGADVILKQFETGPERLRVGLQPAGKAPVRVGAELFAAESGGSPVGIVTSGGFGPSAGGPVAMGYVPATMSDTSTTLYAEVRGKRLPIAVAALPFVHPPTNAKSRPDRNSIMLKFTEDHEWLKIEGVATVGITAHAAEQLGDLVSSSCPRPEPNSTRAARPRQWNRSRPPRMSIARWPARSWKATRRSSMTRRWSIPIPPARAGSSSSSSTMSATPTR
jgi:hypothetical protein